MNDAADASPSAQPWARVTRPCLLSITIRPPFTTTGLLVETPQTAANSAMTFRPGRCRYLHVLAMEDAMRGCNGDHYGPGTRASGRRGGVRRAHRALPNRASGALLSHPRLGAGRRGHAAGDAARSVARARRV